MFEDFDGFLAAASKAFHDGNTRHDENMCANMHRLHNMGSYFYSQI
jgi:hypothetical protein